jgi:DNA-binding XRE family transcriptional regulator
MIEVLCAERKSAVLTPSSLACLAQAAELVSRQLVQRHHERMGVHDELAQILVQLKVAREERGLSLSDLTRLTGMDRSALSKLETGQRPNPTIETLVRYAEALGKRLVISLVDE